MPSIANSKNPKPNSPRLSAFWIMMMLLAAPINKKLPAMVLPAASAMSDWVPTPAWISIGKYNATNGTFDISWLNTTLIPNMLGVVVSCKCACFHCLLSRCGQVNEDYPAVLWTEHLSYSRSLGHRIDLHGLRIHKGNRFSLLQGNDFQERRNIRLSKAKPTNQKAHCTCPTRRLLACFAKQ